LEANKQNNFLRKVEKHVPKRIKTLRTDNGLEFINQEIRKLIKKFVVQHQHIVPYSLEQNGAAERENRIIIEAAKTLIHTKGHKSVGCQYITLRHGRLKKLDALWIGLYAILEKNSNVNYTLKVGRKKLLCESPKTIHRELKNKKGLTKNRPKQFQ